LNAQRAKKMTSTTSDYVAKNYEHFLSVLPQALNQHRNQYALMRDEAVISYYTTMMDAYVTGAAFYKDGKFSIQKVTDTPIDLGFFSHAVSLG
jgi:hypothetical protein